MAVIVTGDVLGDEHSSGLLDDGTPWKKHVLVVLDGTRTVEVRLDKGYEGTIPTRGDYVAIACRVAYGKFNGQHRLPAVEAALTAPAGK